MSKEAINNLLTKGVEEIIVKDHLLRTLHTPKKLRVKFGIDPTGTDLHLGHLVALRKLKQFQDLGHKVVLLIGDFTAMIGDPSGRSETRKPLSEKDVKANYKKYVKQAGKILDLKKSEIVYNSKWYKKGGLPLLMKLASSVTVQQMLEREDFQKRLKNEEGISELETLYPILQGYDSVEVRADVELGAIDQKFNLLMGRRMQRIFNIEEQDVVMIPLLVGIDGVKKMSKSYGNYIALDDKPADMFGKIMSVPDSLIESYFTLLIDKEFPRDLLPYDAKQTLGKEIVSMLHGEKFAEKAQQEFKNVFSNKGVPKEMATIGLHEPRVSILDLVVLSGVISKSAARRLIEQGAVDIDGIRKENSEEILEIANSVTLRVGKTKFFRVVVQ